MTIFTRSQLEKLFDHSGSRRLQGTALSGADLSRANQVGTDLNGVGLSGATLSAANLHEVDLMGATMPDGTQPE